jgi:hypothetical protein
LVEDVHSVKLWGDILNLEAKALSQRLELVFSSPCTTPTTLQSVSKVGEDPATRRISTEHLYL